MSKTKVVVSDSPRDTNRALLHSSTLSAGSNIIKAIAVVDPSCPGAHKKMQEGYLDYCISKKSKQQSVHQNWQSTDRNDN
jgi:hypothetical protein